MADTKISGLTAVTTPAQTDEFAVNQGGTSKKETLDQIISVSKFFGGYHRLVLTGELVVSGLARVAITDYGEGTIIRGIPRDVPGQSWTVPTGYVHTVEDRLILSINARVTVEGNADLRIHSDIAPRDRIVLEGRGGI
jgi:hypothetical protein